MRKGKYTKESKKEWIEKINVNKCSTIIIVADARHKPKYTVHENTGVY